MNGFLYGTALQFKLDIRSKSLLITCYLVPLLFFFVMGGIFTSINPIAKDSLVQSMTIMGISMGAFIGVPPSIVEMYSSEMKKSYKANGVPLFLGLISCLLSAFIHLFIMSLIILLVAPYAFNAVIPQNLPLYFLFLGAFLIVCLSIGGVLGLIVKSQSKLTMVSQILFLPSIMLSGIMFDADMLPKAFGYVGKLFPASWGYRLMNESSFDFKLFIPLIVMFILSVGASALLLKRHESE